MYCVQLWQLFFLNAPFVFSPAVIFVSSLVAFVPAIYLDVFPRVFHPWNRQEHLLTSTARALRSGDADEVLVAPGGHAPASHFLQWFGPGCLNKKSYALMEKNHESELWKSKAGVLVYKDRGGLKIDLATGQNWYIKGKGPSPPPPLPPPSPPEKIDLINNYPPPPMELISIERELIWGGGGPPPPPPPPLELIRGGHVGNGFGVPRRDDRLR